MRSTKRRRHGELARGPAFGTTWGLSRPLAPTKGVAPSVVVGGLRYDRATHLSQNIVLNGTTIYGRPNA